MTYDLVVIGSGPAGEKAATQAAYFGKRVAIVERRPTPGRHRRQRRRHPHQDAARDGAVPDRLSPARVYGVSLALDARLKLAAHGEPPHRRGRRPDDRRRARQHRAHGRRAHPRRGAAAAPADACSVRRENGDERELEAEVILIATGSRPHHPPAIPFDDPAVSDSETHPPAGAAAADACS